MFLFFSVVAAVVVYEEFSKADICDIVVVVASKTFTKFDSPVLLMWLFLLPFYVIVVADVVAVIAAKVSLYCTRP